MIQVNKQVSYCVIITEVTELRQTEKSINNYFLLTRIKLNVYLLINVRLHFQY